MNQNENNNANFLGAGNDVLADRDTNVSNQPMPNVPTMEVEYGGGQPHEAAFSVEYPTLETRGDIPNDGPTVQLTDYSQITDLERTVSIFYTDQTDPSQLSGITNNTNLFTANRPWPIMLHRGTNILVPFGASYLAATRGNQTVTKTETETFNDAVEANYGPATGQFWSGFSLREVNNYKSFGEMKDAIDSYKGRPIAYTRLPQSDMFALEISREGRLAVAALPLFASKIAREYVRDLSEKGIKFNTDLNRNLVQPEVTSAEMLLYSALAAQKTFDDTLWTRLGDLCKLRTSCSKSGAFPTFIMQDVDVYCLEFYQISEKKNNYKTDIPSVYRARNSALITAIENPLNNVAANSLTLSQWVGLYLGGAKTTHILTNMLSQAKALVTATINGMKIVTGAIDMIEGNRGAAFHKVGEYLPIKGVHNVPGNCFLDYIIERPTFSYYYKERVEHSPTSIVGESPTGGNNYVWESCITKGYASAFAKGNLGQRTGLLRRPVGLYKGDKAWTTSEIISIGVYRRCASSVHSGVFLLTVNGNDTLLNPKANIWRKTATSSQLIEAAANSSGTITYAVNLEISNAVWKDEVYGDMYTTVVWSLSSSSDPSTSAFGNVGYNSDVITFAGSYGQSDSDAFGDLSWAPNLGVYEVSTVADVAGDSVNEVSNVAVEVVDLRSFSEPVQLAGYLIGINDMYTQLDISQGPLMGQGSAAGKTDIPIQFYTPYRGAFWMEIVLTTIENIVIAMSSSFTMTYKNNAEVRASKPAGSSGTVAAK